MKLSRGSPIQLGISRSLGNLHPNAAPKLTKTGAEMARKPKAVELRMRKAAAELPLNLWNQK